MRKKLTALISLITVLTLLVGFSAPAFAEDAPDYTAQATSTTLYKVTNVLNNVLNLAIKGLCCFMPKIETDVSNYSLNEADDGFFTGTDSFSFNYENGASWSLGFAQASIIPEKLASGEAKMYTGGYFTQKVSRVYDDQGVNAIALKDADGDIAVFAAVDGVGVANLDVRAIRELVTAELRKTGLADSVVAININATHAHTCIDTQGIGLNLILPLFNNILCKIFPWMELKRSADADFIEGMINTSAQTIVKACSSMQTGMLYYFETPSLSAYTQDGYKYLSDKRYGSETAMQDFFACFRFVPYNESASETWFANIGGHPTKISRESDAVSGDYPHYIEKAMREEYKNANFMFIQGAQAPISVGGEVSDENVKNAVAAISIDDPDGTYTEAKTLGYEFARIIYEAGTDSESIRLVAPVLNAAINEVVVPLNYGLFSLGAASSLLAFNTVRDERSESGLSLISEIGYITLGKDIAILTVPGEMMPEIVWGGVTDAEGSWSGTDWDYEPIADEVRVLSGNTDMTVLCMGLCNDAIGYIVPGNDFAPFIADELEGLKIGDKEVGKEWFGETNGHYEEMLSAGKLAASSICDGFNTLLEKVYN